MRRHAYVLGLILLSACSHFESSRSYLSEMERDDSSMFTPNEDFPVIGGDTGDVGWGTKEYQRRAPASADDLENRRTSQSLKQELRQLEDRQNEENLNFYEDHKHKLATTSERIYLLKLPVRERADYLASRGFLKQESSQYMESSQNRSPASAFGARNNSLNLGMSKDDVMNSWGKPVRVEVAGNPSYENERWAYRVHGATKYIYFESGSVQGWE